jgi:NADH-quinone oxidoreductase subunit L
MLKLIWLIPLLPLAGAAVNGLLGRRFRFPERLVAAVAVASVALAFLLALSAVYAYGFGGHAQWPAPYVTSQEGGFPHSYSWIPGGAVEITQGRADGAGGSPRGALLDVEWSYQLDALSSVFILVITGVGLCIFVFAAGYMHGDPGFYRFFAYLGLFMFSMLVLVMGSNFLMMFVGWEGVGLCSYLLIGYYFDRKEAGDASRKAFITNRIGDFGMVLAIGAVIAAFGSVQYTEVFEAAKSYPLETVGTFGLMSWIALGLFVGACGKSAQIPLYVWLPDAMAGPTPVSALIHAATMVTAGLYMLTRCNVIFQHSQTMMTVVAVVGALTALFAATIGITQNDIKKVLAYSTVSQLGFMFLACGVGAFSIGIFHVMTHAFFKALMFLGAGSVIHGMHHEQDMRRMGGLKRYMPKTYWTFFAGWLAICGIIPFAGFWSKDEILWQTASTSVVSGGWLLWLMATVAATCTAFYMTRLMALTFWGEPRFLDAHAGGQADEAHAHGYDERGLPHDALTEAAGDRPRHEPGEYVGEPHAAPVHTHQTASGAHEAHGEAHGHGTHVPHESPASMWVPLAALAVLAIVGGFVGVGPAFKFVTGADHPGGRLNIVTWLSPVIWNPATGDFNQPHGAGGAEHALAPPAADNLIASTSPGAAGEAAHAAGAAARGPYGDTGFNLAHAVEGVFHSHLAAEWFFIVLSIVAALFGMGLAYLFYVKRPHLPGLWAARLGGLYRASFNKYWVDELYGLVFTRRMMDAARGVYAFDSRGIDGAVNGSAWLTRRLSNYTGLFDFKVVDGAVNGVAYFVRGLMSRLLRAAQTGFAANYALVMVLGLVVAVTFYIFWR